MENRSESRPGLVIRAFGSMLAGWACGSLVFAGWMYVLQGNLVDIDVTIYWTAIFAAIGWLVSFLPLVIFVRPTASMWLPSRLPWIGAVVGVLVFFLLIGWAFAKGAWAGLGLRGLWIEFVPYAVHATVTGAIAGLAYSRALPRPAVVE